MMDLCRSHRLDSGNLLLVSLLNFLVRHFERALSSVLQKQQPQWSVIFLGPRLELLPVLMVVLTRALAQVRWSDRCLPRPSQMVVEELPMEEDQLSSR